MLGNLRRHERQRRERVGAADHAFVGNLGAQCVLPKAFKSGNDALLQAAESGVSVKSFTFVSHAVFKIARLELVQMKAHDHVFSLGLEPGRAAAPEVGVGKDAAPPRLKCCITPCPAARPLAMQAVSK